MNKKYLLYGIVFLFLLGSVLSQAISNSRQQALDIYNSVKDDTGTVSNLGSQIENSFIDENGEAKITLCWQYDLTYNEETEHYKKCRRFNADIDKNDIISYINDDVNFEKDDFASQNIPFVKDRNDLDGSINGNTITPTTSTTTTLPRITTTTTTTSTTTTTITPATSTTTTTTTSTTTTQPKINGSAG